MTETDTDTDELRDTIEVTASKTKVGPLVQRYVDGEFRGVDQPDREHSRYALVRLDNSHNGDYKVAYASDPLLVFEAGPDVTHDELREVLDIHGLWSDRLQAIELPHGDGWRPAFKSTPDERRRFHRIKTRMRGAVQRDMDARGGDHGITAYLPVE